ncbi:hypothetical protein ILYODFUR_027845 [Ilyodon furcidens]|uniref:Uncharacterized protein n=1 Tax=Ilyodon furcidens TaxID=33524 RepID=A0ABV0UA80_9TELE
MEVGPLCCGEGFFFLTRTLELIRVDWKMDPAKCRTTLSCSAVMVGLGLRLQKHGACSFFRGEERGEPKINQSVHLCSIPSTNGHKIWIMIKRMRFHIQASDG